MPGEPQVVPRGGRFLGSASAGFLDQTAVDIYLQNIWTSTGTVLRIGKACVGWGMSVGFIQAAYADVRGRPGPWTTSNIRRNRLIVQDHGEEDLGVQNTPHPLPNFAPPGHINLHVNGHVTTGPRLPWHHRISLRVRRRNGGMYQLHYHKHERRQDHNPDPPKILPKEKGKHYIFDEIEYKTQIQNCRRARPAN